MDFDSDVLTREEREDLLLSMNEVYFGKSEDIQAIERQLNTFRKFYLGGNRLPAGDQNLLKLNRMIAKFFGFSTFSLIIVFDPIPAINTLPISYDMDTAKKENSYIIDTNTYKFKKNCEYNCVVIVTSGLIFNNYFTTEEIMAAILYEIGYAFYGCFSHSNAVLSNVYSATLIASTIINFILAFTSAYKAGKVINQNIIDTASNNIKNEPAFDRRLKQYPKLDPKKLLDTLLEPKLSGIYKTSIYSATCQAISSTISIFLRSPLYLAFEKKFYKEQSNTSVRSVSTGFKSYMGLAFKYFGYNINYVNDVIFNMVVQKMSFFDSLDIIKMLLPYQDALAKAMNPMTWINIPIFYKTQRSAQNFPTMYGYGPAEISYFNKMSSKDRFQYIRAVNKKTPLFSIASDIVLLPSKILNAAFDPSPNQISMCLDQINLLKNELNKADLSPEARMSINKEISKCEKSIKDLTDCSSRTALHPDVAKFFYNRILWRLTGGMDLKDVLFDSQGKFSEYDKNAEAKTPKRRGVKELFVDTFNSPENIYSYMNESVELSSRSLMNDNDVIFEHKGSLTDKALVSHSLLSNIGLESSLYKVYNHDLEEINELCSYMSNGQLFYMNYKQPLNTSIIGPFNSVSEMTDNMALMSGKDSLVIPGCSLEEASFTFKNINEAMQNDPEFAQFMNEYLAESYNDPEIVTEGLIWDATKIETPEDVEKMLKRIADKQDVPKLLSILRTIMFFLSIAGPAWDFILKFILPTSGISSAKYGGQIAGILIGLFHGAGNAATGWLGGMIGKPTGAALYTYGSKLKKWFFNTSVGKRFANIFNIQLTKPLYVRFLDTVKKIIDLFGHAAINLSKFVIGDWIVIKLINLIFNMNYATIGEKELAYTVVIKMINDHIKIAEKAGNKEQAEKFKELRRRTMAALKTHNLTTPFF